MSKRLIGYLNHLLILGIIGFISTSIFAAMILQSIHEEDWNIIYLPLKIIGVTFTYLLVNNIARGGAVTIYFTKHTPNEDERLLNKLIAKYKSKILVASVPILYILIDIIIGLSRYQLNNSISFDAIFGYLFFIPFFICGVMMQGVKYISAWGNIQRNLKKDPSGARLILSVKNDPTLAKLDNPKPFINIPQLIKSLFK